MHIIIILLKRLYYTIHIAIATNLNLMYFGSKLIRSRPDKKIGISASLNKTIFVVNNLPDIS